MAATAQYAALRGDVEGLRIRLERLIEDVAETASGDDRGSRPDVWRARTKEHDQERRRPDLLGKATGLVRETVMGRFTAGDASGPNALPYRYAANRIDAGDVPAAADYLAQVFRGVPPEKMKDAIAGAKASMSERSPLGGVAEKELRGFLTQYPEAERRMAVDRHRRWLRDYNAALGMAVRQWRATRPSKEPPLEVAP